MLAASALSVLPDSGDAIKAVLDRLADVSGGEPFDLAMVFGSIDHAGVFGDIGHRLRDGGLATNVLGCTAETVIAEGTEVEEGPALGIWGIRLPAESRVRTFQASDIEGLAELTPNGPDDNGPTTRAMFLLGDPFTFDAEAWLGASNERFPRLSVLGGLASASAAPGRNRLLFQEEALTRGAVGALVDGPFEVISILSQGCRPIGRPMIVTKIDQNIILELGRRAAIEVLQEQLGELSEPELNRARQGLHLGRVMSEYRDSFGRGDFLIRNVLGVTPEGGIAVSDILRVGQTVQFHVRDAETADEDLRGLLNDSFGSANRAPAGGLLFSCNGRGTRLFPEPNHDAGVISDVLGSIPVAGFFAMGELGPVAGQNYLHGFTASLALFVPESA